MQSEPSHDRTDPRIPPPLGIVRQPTQHDPRLDAKILAAVGRIAPGTELRSGIDDIIRSREGALIVIGEPNELSFLFSRRDAGSTSRSRRSSCTSWPRWTARSSSTRGLHEARVRERPADAGPDDRLERDRHAASHRGARRQADGRARDLDLAAARDGHGLRRPAAATSSSRSPTCSRRRTRRSRRSRRTAPRLEQVLTRLTALEFQNAVMLDDVLVVLQRAELTTRMAEEIERDLRRARGGGTADPDAARRARRPTCRTRRRRVVYDYHAEGGATRTQDGARGARGGCRTSSCSSSSSSRRCSAIRASVNPLDYSVTPRGYRVLSHIPRLPDERGQARGREPRRARRDRPCVPARAGGGRGRRDRPGARDQGGPAPAPGAQSGRPLPPDLALSRAFP